MLMSWSSASNYLGPLLVVRIVYDKDSGKSRGFGFVIFSNEDDAKCAKDAMDGKVRQIIPHYIIARRNSFWRWCFICDVLFAGTVG